MGGTTTYKEMPLEISQASNMIQSTKKSIQAMRSDEAFEAKLATAISVAEDQGTDTEYTIQQSA